MPLDLNSIVLVIIFSAVSAVFWAILASIAWLVVGLTTNQMSRYWLVVLGTLRGAFILGSVVGMVRQPSTLEGVLDVTGIPCLLGAVGGAVWGYYGLTARLRSLLSAHPIPPATSGTPAQRPTAVNPPQPTVNLPPHPSEPIVEAESEPLSELPLADPQAEPGAIPTTPLDRARQGDGQAIAFLISRQLEPQGIAVQVQRQNNKLRIGLQREAGLNPEQTVAFLRNGLEKLNPQGVQQVEVIGQSDKGLAQVWRRSFSLTPPENPTPPFPPLPPRQSSNTYRPPRDPRNFVLEIGSKRVEIPAIVIWAIAIGILVRGSMGVAIHWAMMLWPLLRLVLALLPALVAKQRGRPFVPWLLYGFIYFPVALVFALLLKQGEALDFSHRDLRQVSFQQQSLQRANFQGANVAGVDFSQTDLAAANFKQANCTGARFNQASIRGTCFDHAILDRATFVQARQGKAAISINQVFSSIPPILWGLIITLFILLSLAGLLTLAMGPLFRILLFTVWVYGVVSSGITLSLIKLTHINREAAPLILGCGVGLAILVRFSADELTPIIPGLIAIALGLAAIAQWFLQSNQWHPFGAAIGALGTLCFTEAWAVFFKVYTVPVGSRWGFAVVSAIIGYLIGASIQQEITSFRAARLVNTDFTRADLKLADFRDAEIQRTIFNRARMKGAFMPTGRQQRLATAAIRLSEQMTAYLQRLRT